MKKYLLVLIVIINSVILYSQTEKKVKIIKNRNDVLENGRSELKEWFIANDTLKFESKRITKKDIIALKVSQALLEKVSIENLEAFISENSNKEFFITTLKVKGFVYSSTNKHGGKLLT